MFSTARCLIRREGGGVFVFDPEHGSVVAGVDQIEHGHFFGQDTVEGEPLMAFAVVRLARRGQPHTDVIDGGFEYLPRRLLGIDRAVGRRGSRLGRRG